ncbi:hypothetical protein F5Y00DRAFT_265382 [Daldinia vernicosa]|uniref:uncharacterized protein n=1 Tax=Daldinia vernicosa TaxID=114800 RepID=UPI002008140D|nr:uncharacterized protein F5Y00DRAFT_265382 [Daldinia vernicosa]KAI0845576.1 hypothetical protein F5Y00DRAFT_265382 [Daldinia vernicosa]
MRPSQYQPLLLSLLLPLVVAHPYPQAVVKKDAVAYTTTWTETRTYTSTISSFLGDSTAPAGGSDEPCVPPEGSGQIECGPICCASWQYCAYEGQCLANGGGSWTQWTTVGVVTTQYSAPYRVTSGSTVIETSPPTTTTGTAASETASATTTPAPVATTSGSLSGGAIAGIVVGTIAGVILLLLLCFCCIVRGLWGTFAGLFGGGKKKRETERIEIIEEGYSRRGSRHGSAYAGGAGASAARPVHRTWFGGGGGGGRPTSAAARKEKKSGGGAGWLAAALGATALLLGLRRSDKQRRTSREKPPRGESDFSSSYYTDSYTASSPRGHAIRDVPETREERELQDLQESLGDPRGEAKPPTPACIFTNPSLPFRN